MGVSRVGGIDVSFTVALNGRGSAPSAPAGRCGREMVVRELGREAPRVSEKIAPRTDK